MSTFFGEEQAKGYDERWKKMAPINSSLHFLMESILSALPSEASILCVGAGTGAEVKFLAEKFPLWRFTVVEPSAPMLKVCRKKAEDFGFASRCEFHEGYLETLPKSGEFDGATSILVSQFLTQSEERKKFFEQIAQRLKIGGYLINADLATRRPFREIQSLLEVWCRAQGAPLTASAGMVAAWEKDVAVSHPDEVERLIRLSGFEAPVLFHQALFIHAWYAQKK